MRQVLEKTLSALGQLKSRELAEKNRNADKRPEPKAAQAEFGMSPEDALRVGTVAGYK